MMYDDRNAEKMDFLMSSLIDLKLGGDLQLGTGNSVHVLF